MSVVKLTASAGLGSSTAQERAEVTRIGKRLMRARDEYVKAWLEWAATDLCLNGPQKEAELLGHLLQSAWQADD